MLEDTFAQTDIDEESQEDLFLRKLFVHVYTAVELQMSSYGRLEPRSEVLFSEGTVRYLL